MIPKEIPVKFIMEQVDALYNVAKDMPEGKFKDTIILRGQHYLDLLESWKEKNE